MKQIVGNALRKRGWDVVSFDPRFNLEARKSELLRRLDIKHVLDVVANTGQFARYLRSIDFTGRITSFEPISETFRLLSENMSGDRLWKGVNATVGASSGKIDINVSHNSVSSSIRQVGQRHVAAHPDSATARVETVRLVSINE